MICLGIWHRFETSKASQLSKEGHRELFCLCLVFFLELREFQLLSLSLGRSLSVFTFRRYRHVQGRRKVTDGRRERQPSVLLFHPCLRCLGLKDR